MTVLSLSSNIHFIKKLHSKSFVFNFWNVVQNVLPPNFEITLPLFIASLRSCQQKVFEVINEFGGISSSNGLLRISQGAFIYVTSISVILSPRLRAP